MNSDILYFLITLGVIIVVNGAFFIIMLAFCGVMAAIQVHFQRKMQKTLHIAIKSVKKDLGSGKIFNTMVGKMEKSVGGIIGNVGQKFEKWAPAQAGPLGGLMTELGDAIGNKKLGKIGAALDRAAVQMEKQPPKPQEPAQEEEGPEWTNNPKAEAEFQEAHAKLLKKLEKKYSKS